jgi:YidC/Oxa1 family membrane protein insertase
MNPINMLSGLMVQALDFFYSLYPNYGVAIIMLTVAMKLALYPLTLQSTQQMGAIQKLQPKLKELQAKHKDKPKELQQKTMELYQKEGVNPLGGCLPMLLQLPFFIALFFAIKGMTFEGIGTTFLWIKDLSVPDPTYVLVALIALSTFWTQKTTPQPAQKGASSMMLFMPLFIAFISAPFPAGVQLYWLVQTLLTALQQAYILKKPKKEAQQ